MKKENDRENKLRAIANSAIIMAVSRLASPLAVAMLGFMFTTISSMQSDLASIKTSFGLKVEEYNSRIKSLEDWRIFVDEGDYKTTQKPN